MPCRLCRFRTCEMSVGSSLFLFLFLLETGMAECLGGLLYEYGEAIPNALSSPCGEQVGGLTSFTRLKIQAVELKRRSSLAMSGPRPLQVVALMPLQTVGKPTKGEVISIERLRQDSCTDPSQWWGNRFEKNSPRPPDFINNRTNEALSSEDCSDPPWGYTELAPLRQGQAKSGDSSDLKQRTESDQTLALDGFEYQTRPEVLTAGLNKTASATSEDVRTLCKAGQVKEVLHILNRRIIRVDCNTYVCVLQDCINSKDLADGKQVHAHIIQSGLKPNIFLLNNLLNMYAKCGSVVNARQVFDKMPERDTFTWNIMISAYAKHGYGREAFEIYEQMQQEGLMPDEATFSCILNACASLGALEKGKDVHSDIIKAGVAPNVIVETALADMYAKCGSMMDARQVFDHMAERNVVSWSAMIAGYAQHGCGREAFEMYKQMLQEGVTPNRVTFIGVLDACASLGALEKGKEVHADIMKAGITSYVNLENTLVNMYAKCGSMKDASEVFNNMSKRDVFSWNTLTAGFAQHGCGWEALNNYEQMQQEGVMPNRVTFISILNACARLGALEKGKEVHAGIMKAGITSYINLNNALVDMYAKCGSVKDAYQVFDNMAERNLISWNAMIAGYAQHGCGRDALQLFEQMQQEGLKPEGITFTSILSACRHVGLVDEGCHYFYSMNQDYSLAPTVEDFSCMVDLLGRAGQLDEAEDFINEMPFEAGASVWGALLSACSIHGNVKLAERAAKYLFKCEPQQASTYVLLSNIYAAAGK